MREKNPCPWWTLHHWLWYIRQPGHHCHRMFWGWGKEAKDGIYAIYWLGIITLWWHENTGWSWSWNFD